jgi:hypothetical protein
MRVFCSSINFLRGAGRRACIRHAGMSELTFEINVLNR